MDPRTVRNLIDGQWVESVTGRARERRDPGDDRQVVSVHPESDAKDADAAVSAVLAGWSQWADTAPEKRGRALEKAADVLESQRDTLVEELVREEGKTRAEATMEVSRTPLNLRFYAGEALRTAGQTLPTGDGSLVFTSRSPVGVVAAITPWNFPLNIPSRKLGPALAAGNGVVFKPSEVTPLLGQRLVDALLEGGVPAGALAVLHGGAEVSQALVADDRVGAITFTGSTAVGESIHRVVRASQRTQLEMGGKNPVVVLEDADLDRAATLIAKGAFGLSGQACTGTSRVLVHDAVHDALLERVAAKAAALRLGHGLESGVDVGPQATARQKESVLGHVRRALDDGARLVVGGPGDPGEDDPALAHGHFVRPTVFADVDPGSALATEEVFGPVLAFLRVGSFDEAIELAGATRYGLSAAIVTADVGRALRFAREVPAGLVKINQTTTGQAMNAPFGGLKDSSTQTSKEQAGEAMMAFYTVDKTVYLSA
ncbi:aldehyde dehydrogenase family protein [Geodermatophilus sabuli]|uniref:Aldehyde dehydrogenase (NAD+) n=1 Tax=Geodermatophilus sabuli TaxID=1564158 RepID=A0A285EFD3_9ACTN|nr:aldehyde dehydrogenase family protein [Geodermatophilus sabuli]MBB3086496.1 aldehyde dehydrogenase (NAD+) [Geodermatophilus sabuli]SNX97852.1 aldehyde dehydrogenase (NAD+) [Geodermatophilus sabuli]